MEALSVRDYRNNMASSFARADKGERVLIRRNNHLYALSRVEEEITPELQQRIDEARKEFRKGNCISLRSKEELNAFFESL